MTNLNQIKSELQFFYWTEKNSMAEINIRKKNYQEVFENKKNSDATNVFDSFLTDIRKLLSVEIRNTTVTFFPSFSFKVILNIENIGNYTIISEYHFYLSILSNVYTGYFVKVVIDKIKINSKEKNVMFKPLIITSSVEPYLEEFELAVEKINTHFSKLQFIALQDCFVNIDAEGITYTVNKIILFHLIFADFKKEDYKIIVVRQNN